MNKKAKVQKILLFTNNDATYFKAEISTFRKIIDLLGKMSPFKVQTINISNSPDLAQKYKIEALPTLIAKDWRFIGEPGQDKLVSMFEDIV